MKRIVHFFPLFLYWLASLCIIIAHRGSLTTFASVVFLIMLGGGIYLTVFFLRQCDNAALWRFHAVQPVCWACDVLAARIIGPDTAMHILIMPCLALLGIPAIAAWLAFMKQPRSTRICAVFASVFLQIGMLPVLILLTLFSL